MRKIYYLGSLGTKASTESGSWTAPGFEETEREKNSRELDDAAAASHVASGCFAYVEAPKPSKKKGATLTPDGEE